MSENFEITNNIHTLKSSAQILDEIFRELKEKSENGTLLPDSDLSTVLGSTIVNEKSVTTKKKVKKKKSKHRHSHKHKKRKRRSEKHLSSSSSEEWVPAETMKGNERVAEDIFTNMNKTAVEHLVHFKYDPTETRILNKKKNIENTDAILTLPVADQSDHSFHNFEIEASRDLRVHSNMVIGTKLVVPLKSRSVTENINQYNFDTIQKHSSEDVCLKHSPKRLKIVPCQDVDKRIEVVNNTADISIGGDVGPIPKEMTVGCILGPNTNSTNMQQESDLSNIADNKIGHETEFLSLSHHLRSNATKKHEDKHSSKYKKASRRDTSRSRSRTRSSPLLTPEKKICSRSRRSRTSSLSPFSEGNETKAVLQTSRSRRSRSPSKRIATHKLRRSKSSDIKDRCSPHMSRKEHSTSTRTHLQSDSTTTKSRLSQSPRHRSRSSRSSTRDHSANSSSLGEHSSRRSRDERKTSSSIFEEKIDKAKLLEIARKNAMMMMAEGKLTVPQVIDKPKQEKFNVKPCEKSVEELTNFCKLLSKKEKEEEEDGKCEKSDKVQHSSDEDDDKGAPFVHHPFKLRDHQPSIIMNIRNAVQLPIKTAAEKVADSAKLRIQFPVSSGTQHRKQEWVPVSPKKEEIVDAVREEQVTPISSPSIPPSSNIVFPQNCLGPTVDIGTIVSQRLKAVRKLMENPHDMEALGQMYKSQQQMQNWAQSKQLPGQFTGSTDAHILTPEELAGPAHLQAWVRKDQFNRAAPVQGGFGMYMLQKMGWKPGEGLGKNKEGAAEPLILDIKTDKKGLVSQGEVARKNSVPIAKDLSGKHPVSALVELCNKRRWLPPEFVLIHDSGPDHKKNFVFKVVVNGEEYQPTIASPNKKHAKAQAATVCLQSLGLVPRNPVT